MVASVAYFDPGNWSVDLQAGSQFGYNLLFVLLLAGLGAVILQTFAFRLGCVTGLDLASHCRLLFNNHPTHPRLVRGLFLYPLYVICEIAIIATDLAELLGSAIGLCLLFPSLPLWAGVLLTSADVLLFLLVCHKDGKRPVRLFEVVIILLVLATFLCFVVLIAEVKPLWPSVFHGYLPTSSLFKPGAMYTSVGILGATVMPHALFLGSSLATLDRVSEQRRESLPVPVTTLSKLQTAKQYISSLVSIGRTSELKDTPKRHGERQNSSLEFIQAHMSHGITDIVTSLLGFATLINSSILILAATVFFYESPSSNAPAGLFDAHSLVQSRLGNAAGIVFAFALLCAGQSASITATLAGQIVSEGFIEWKLSPFARRLITRLLGLIPSTIVAATVGQHGIDTLLVASQVALSIVLPFVVFPLVYLTSSPIVMQAGKAEGSTSYHNSKLMATVGYSIFVIVLAANGYALISLAKGASP